MEPAVKNIKIRRGDTKELFLRVRTRVFNETEGAFEPGPYLDLTGYTVTAQVRASKDDVGSPLLEFTVTMGNQADLVNGRGAVLLKLTPAQTASVPTNVPSGVYDVQFAEPDNDAFTYLEGGVTFDKDVTR